MVASVTFPVSVILRMSDQFSGPLRRSTGVLNKFSKTAVDAGRRLTAGLTLPIGLVGGAAIKTFLDYENALQDIRIASDMTESALKGLQGTMKDVALTTKYTPAEVALFSKGLLKGGLSDIETRAVLRDVANLAVQAPEVPLDVVSNSFISMLRATQTPVSEASRVADLMTVAANNTTASVGELLEGFKLATSSGTIAGLNLQDTIFGLGLIKTGSALAGTLGGTAMGRALLDLAQIHKRPELAAAFARAGIRHSSFFTDGKFDLARVLDSLEQLTPAQRNSITGDFEQRGMRGMIGLLNASVIGKDGKPYTGSAALQELRRRYAEDVGIASEKAAIKMEGLSGKLRYLQAAAATAAIAGVNPVTESLKNLVGWAHKGLNAYIGLDNGTRAFIAKLAAFLAILGPAGLFAGWSAIGIKGLLSFGKLVAMTPWGRVITALALLSGMLFKLATMDKNAAGVVRRSASGAAVKGYLRGGSRGAFESIAEGSGPFSFGSIVEFFGATDLGRWMLGLGGKRRPRGFGKAMGTPSGAANDILGIGGEPARKHLMQYEHIIRLDPRTGKPELIPNPLLPHNTGLILETD